MHCRKRDKRVVDAIVGENGDRFFCRKLALYERLRNRADSAQHFRIRGAPPALPGPLGEKHRVGRRRAPVFEHVAEIAAIRFEPLRRAQDDAAIGKRGDIDAGRGEADVGEGRLHDFAPQCLRI